MRARLGGHVLVALEASDAMQSNVLSLISSNLTPQNSRRRCVTPLSPHRYDLTIINKHYHFRISSDQFPLPVRSAVKSNLTAWCCQAVLYMQHRSLLIAGVASLETCLSN